MLRVPFGEKFDPAIPDNFQRWLGQRRHADEPLIGQIRLDWRFGAIGMADLRLVRLFFFQQTLGR